jgi:hypothetical protein
MRVCQQRPQHRYVTGKGVNQNGILIRKSHLDQTQMGVIGCLAHKFHIQSHLRFIRKPVQIRRQGRGFRQQNRIHKDNNGKRIGYRVLKFFGLSFMKCFDDDGNDDVFP